MQMRLDETHGPRILIEGLDVPEKNLKDVFIEGGDLVLTLSGLPTLGQIISLERRENRRYEIMWSGKHRFPLSALIREGEDNRIPVKTLGYNFSKGSIVVPVVLPSKECI